MYFCCGCRRARTSAINGWFRVCKSRCSCFTPESITAFSAASLVPRANCSPCSSTGVSPRPRKQTTTGLRQARARSSTLRATAGAGGLEISTMISVCGSFSSIPIASSIIRPPIFSLRSRPPVPISCETPPPNSWIRTLSSWLPVPDAPTIPMLPRRTALPKQSAAPLIIAVPQSGPIISSPFSWASCLSASSSSTVTLSENSITLRSFCSA